MVIEVVSNRTEKEDSDKLRDYARVGIPFHVIFDPAQHLSDQVLRVYALHTGDYVEHPTGWLARAQIGVTVWTGRFEERAATWLRWCDADGTLIPTGAERAEQAEKRAEQQRERAERLAARLRELGIDPDLLER